MAGKHMLNAADYVVIGLVQLISVGIGWKFRLSGGKQKSTTSYLKAGGDMPTLPVILSIGVTMLSAITMLGTSADVYRYGLQQIVEMFCLPIGMSLAAFVIVPVYFQCGVSTTYEFIELRFGKVTRYLLSAIFVIQMVTYMSVTLYAPCIALSAVTDLSMEACIVLFGAICTLYCTLGGLKAVLWTDAFQSLIMITTVLSLLISGVMEAGGISSTFNRMYSGRRLEIFNMELDLTTRYTFWNCLSFGIFYGSCTYGASQIEIQRLMSLKNAEKAKRTLLLSAPLCVALYSICYFLGAVLYAVYYTCDPVLNSKETGVTKYDQLVPFYIISKFGSTPGMTGLCIAGIFCCALSTISSALNSAATVTVVDFLKPFAPTKLDSEKRTVLVAKVMSVLYGGVCIAMAFLMSGTRNLKQLGGTLYAISEGPAAAVFFSGVLSRRISEKSVLCGFVAGYFFSAWIAFGTLIYGHTYPPLPLSNSTCSAATNGTVLLTSTTANSTPWSMDVNAPMEIPLERKSFIMHEISFEWLRAIGFLSTIIVVLVSSQMIDRTQKLADPRCLSPVVKFFRKDIQSKELMTKEANSLEVKS